MISGGREKPVVCDTQHKPIVNFLSSKKTWYKCRRLADSQLDFLIACKTHAFFFVPFLAGINLYTRPSASLHFAADHLWLSACCSLGYKLGAVIFLFMDWSFHQVILENCLHERKVIFFVIFKFISTVDH